MLLRKILVVFTISLFTLSAQAQDLGPAEGSKIPHDLSLMTTAGKVENFDDLKGENGLALFFVRSFDWCPHCKRQANEVNSRAQEFRDRGLNPVFVSYDSPEIQKNYYGANNFTMTILSDAENEVINAFGVLNADSISERNPLYGYPHPVVFIIAPDGTIKSKLYVEKEDGSYGSAVRERPDIDDILAAIDAE